MITENCPFCTAPPLKLELVLDLANIYVRCNQCGARGPKAFSGPQAENGWNLRMTEQQTNQFDQSFKNIFGKGSKI